MPKTMPMTSKAIVDLAETVSGVAVKRDTNSTSDEARASENLRLCLKHDEKLQEFNGETKRHAKTENTKRLELALNFLKLPIWIGAGLLLENQFQVINGIIKLSKSLGL